MKFGNDNANIEKKLHQYPFPHWGHHPPIGTRCSTNLLPNTCYTICWCIAASCGLGRLGGFLRCTCGSAARANRGRVTVRANSSKVGRLWRTSRRRVVGKNCRQCGKLCPPTSRVRLGLTSTKGTPLWKGPSAYTSFMIRSIKLFGTLL